MNGQRSSSRLPPEGGPPLKVEGPPPGDLESNLAGRVHRGRVGTRARHLKADRLRASTHHGLAILTSNAKALTRFERGRGLFCRVGPLGRVEWHVDRASGERTVPGALDHPKEVQGLRQRQTSPPNQVPLPRRVVPLWEEVEAPLGPRRSPQVDGRSTGTCGAIGRASSANDLLAGGLSAGQSCCPTRSCQDAPRLERCWAPCNHARNAVSTRLEWPRRLLPGGLRIRRDDYPHPYARAQVSSLTASSSGLSAPQTSARAPRDQTLAQERLHPGTDARRGQLACGRESADLKLASRGTMRRNSRDPAT